ncbi:PEP-CTERM sorting domain-containing protein, partial [Microcystis aeruginosa]
YTLSLEKSSLAVPEPSAILGILAVVGAGAFARRKS